MLFLNLYTHFTKAMNYNSPTKKRTLLLTSRQHLFALCSVRPDTHKQQHAADCATCSGLHLVRRSFNPSVIQCLGRESRAITHIRRKCNTHTHTPTLLPQTNNNTHTHTHFSLYIIVSFTSSSSSEYRLRPEPNRRTHRRVCVCGIADSVFVSSRPTRLGKKSRVVSRVFLS